MILRISLQDQVSDGQAPEESARMPFVKSGEVVDIQAEFNLLRQQIVRLQDRSIEGIKDKILQLAARPLPAFDQNRAVALLEALASQARMRAHHKAEEFRYILQQEYNKEREATKKFLKPAESKAYAYKKSEEYFKEKQNKSTPSTYRVSAGNEANEGYSTTIEESQQQDSENIETFQTALLDLEASLAAMKNLEELVSSLRTETTSVQSGMSEMKTRFLHKLGVINRDEPVVVQRGDLVSR
ncbi:Hypp6961 [Branchiostoma lanceolatum]|uniref:Hypp6961 protein n=1 Tax=Branchiostoma lanceolatum TaxID=7740 RepID=A0A8K0EBD5_BRALA|nr:Hypp6961 [Branchiostoma lanceolatum]